MFYFNVCLQLVVTLHVAKNKLHAKNDSFFPSSKMSALYKKSVFFNMKICRLLVI